MNRALRKAYGIGICSIEEIGSSPEPPQAAPEPSRRASEANNGNGDGSSVRDRLYQIIRHHHLDPNLVTSYATDFCSVSLGVDRLELLLVRTVLVRAMESLGGELSG